MECAIDEFWKKKVETFLQMGTTKKKTKSENQNINHHHWLINTIIKMHSGRIFWCKKNCNELEKSKCLIVFTQQKHSSFFYLSSKQSVPFLISLFFFGFCFIKCAFVFHSHSTKLWQRLRKLSTTVEKTVIYYVCIQIQCASVCVFGAICICRVVVLVCMFIAICVRKWATKSVQNFGIKNVSYFKYVAETIL